MQVREPVQKPVQDYITLIAYLRSQKVVCETSGGAPRFFTPEGLEITVEGGHIHAFKYEDSTAVEEEAALVSSEGNFIGAKRIKGTKRRHFYKKELLIAVYEGDDATVKEALERAFGPQFAGG